MDKKMNVLCLIAHPDDAELMAGGTIAMWAKQGHKVHTLVFTNGRWRSPDGVVIRDAKRTLLYEKKAAEILGYTVENLDYPALELKFEDKLVQEALMRVDKLNIDTIICPWERDTHHDHEIVSRIAIAVSKRVPRILMGQISYYLRDFFTPNIFVDITSTWDKKIEALKSFESEWERKGEDWYEFLDNLTRYYGKICGVERAEGFISKKFLTI